MRLTNTHKDKKAYYWMALGLGLLICTLGLCYQYKQHKTAETLEQASLAYESVMTALKDSDPKIAIQKAEDLIEAYPNTPYAPLAAFTLAKLAIMHKDMPLAIERLKTAVKVGKEGLLGHIARVRLARVLTQEKQYDEALKVLEIASTQGYVTLYEEVKGDIYVKQQHIEKAKEAYAAAIKAAPVGAPITALQLKHSGLIGES